METIKFSRNSFWYKFWNFISFFPFRFDEPKDTCTLKRQLIVRTLLALVSLPYFFLFHLIKVIVNSGGKGGVEWLYVSAGLSTAISLLSAGAMKGWSVSYLMSNLYMFGILMGILLFIALVFIVVGLYESLMADYRAKHPKKFKPKKVKNPSMIKVLYRGLKEKLCSHIEFTD